MRKRRKQYTAEEKVIILRRHLLDRIPVSELCDVYGLQPTVFYRWQKQFFEQGATVFRNPNDNQTNNLKQQVTKLEEKLAKKDEVLGEVMEEYVSLKKALGAP
ncbi:MAG: transposase [Anaerolineales bacterium]|nr:transposase [Anaerolineales bacterium]